MKEYHRRTGTTVLLVSHSMEDIANYADKVLVMDNARVAMYAETAKIFAEAPHLLELGLSVPQVTKIFIRLREMGLDIPQPFCGGDSGPGGKVHHGPWCF